MEQVGALRGGALGRKGKFLVRVQTHWRLLSCCSHVLREATEKQEGRETAENDVREREREKERQTEKESGIVVGTWREWMQGRGSEGCKQPWLDKQTDRPETTS